MSLPPDLPHSLKITKKQRAFADSYLESGNGTQSALSSYDCSPRSAREIAYQNLRKAKVRAYLQEQLLTKDLMDESIATLRRALTSTKPVSVNGETVEWPDTSNQVKTAEHLLKLAVTLTDVTKATNNMTAEDYDDQYYRQWFMDENKREPTKKELADFKESIIDVEAEEAGAWVMRSEKTAASLMPKDFIDDEEPEAKTQ